MRRAVAAMQVGGAVADAWHSPEQCETRASYGRQCALAMLAADTVLAGWRTLHWAQAQRHLIAVSLAAKRPDQAQLQALLQPVAAEITAAGALAEQRRSPAFQHAKSVAEALGALSWLAYTGPGCGEHPHAPLAAVWSLWHPRWGGSVGGARAVGMRAESPRQEGMRASSAAWRALLSMCRG